MDLSDTCWTLFLLSVVSYWFYYNTDMDIDYERHPQLIDLKTGVKKEPRELIDLTRLISKTDEYINETSSEERLYDLAYQMNLETPFIIDQSYSNKYDLKVSGWPVANQKKCGAQLDWILNKLETNRNYTFIKGKLGYELTTFMDSFGRPLAGLHAGFTAWMGSFRICEKASLDNGNIKTRYCWARFRPKWWPKSDNMYALTSIKIGICLPETCDTNSFAQHNRSIELLAKHELPELYKEGLEFKSLFCLPDERSPIRQMPVSGRIYIWVVSSWLALVIIASVIYQICFQKPEGKQGKSVRDMWREAYQPKAAENLERQRDPGVFVNLLACLSMRQSIKTFKTNVFAIKYARGQRVRVNLSGLDTAKFLMAICVVLAHGGLLLSLYSRSLESRIGMSLSNPGRMTLSVGRFVDTFFLFFGLLTTYTMMRKFDTKQLGNPLIWIGINMGILLRVAPLFMLVYWFNRSVSPYLSFGPWWDYGVDKYTMRGVCMRDSWWKSIPHLGSIGQPAIPSCNLPSWFLVSYAQISLILPLITYLLCKLPNYLLKFALIAILTLMPALNIAYRLYNQTTIREEGFTLYGALLMDLMEKYESTGHISTFGRLGSVSIGCFTGYLLRQYEIGVIPKWPKWLEKTLTAVLGFVASFFILFLPIIGREISEATGHLATLNEFVSLNLVSSFIWPMLNAIVVLNLTTVNNHRVFMRFIGHTFWHVLNRLNFALFLVHWELLFIAITHYEQGPTYGFQFDVAKLWPYGLFMSLLLAFVLHIVVETPISKAVMLIADAFTKRGRDTVKTKVEGNGLGDRRIDTQVSKQTNALNV